MLILETAPVEHLPEPAGILRPREILLRVGVSLLTAVITPAILFATTLLVFNVATAMIVALAWTVGAIVWRAATGRSVSGLLVLTGTIMAVKTAITFATGNTFIYFVQPIFVDVFVATAFLGSLWTARPLVARLAPDFCPMDDELAARPAICRLLRSLTLMWGLVILVKGSVTLWLLVSLSTVDFVLIKSGSIISLTVVAIAVTLIWSVAVCRKEGVLGLPRRELTRLTPRWGDGRPTKG